MPYPFHRLAAAALLAAALTSLATANSSGTRVIPPDDALLLLRDGNRRFVAGASVHFHQDALRRHTLATDGQKPFAVVLACADSRVPPELIFDQGLGCLFVVRVAGQVARNDEVATVEYGVAHLGARLVLVLGHTGCGAVTAVVEDAPVGPNLAELVAPIAPAAARARRDQPGLRGAPLVDAVVRAHVENTVADLPHLSSELAAAAAQHQVRVVGALYDLETGAVEFLEARPPAPPPEDPAVWAPRPPAGTRH